MWELFFVLFSFPSRSNGRLNRVESLHNGTALLEGGENWRNCEKFSLRLK